jgi:hypothetical protein
LCPEAFSAPAKDTLEHSTATSAIGAKIRIMTSSPFEIEARPQRLLADGRLHMLD